MPELQNKVFRAIANCTYDWESWVGPNRDTIWVNPAVERITGWSAEECLRLPDYPAVLVHPDDRETIRAALQAAREGGSGNDLEFRILRRDGGERWGAMSWQPLSDATGLQLGYRTSVRDITERKRMEQRLKEALVQAKEAERVRTDFLARVSHELRTPIHNILGYTDLLERSSLNPEQRRWNEIVKDQSEALLRLVEDLLDLSTLEATQAPRSRELFEPRALIAAVVDAQRIRFLEKKLSLKLDLGPLPDRVLGDPKAIAQILRNLLDNARKFTHEGGVVVQAHQRMNDIPASLLLVVQDTGIGMKQEDISDLRKPFVQGDTSRSRTAEGVGLGLAIVDQLLDQIGGTLSVETRPGQGSTFTIKIPAPTPATEFSSASMDLEKHPPPKSVLVVDDHPVSRELAEAFLERLHVPWLSAGTAEEALAYCREQAFEVILMDLHMPRIDGVALSQLVRAQCGPDGRAPRIIAMTADVFGSKLGGFDGYLSKPVRFATLRQTLFFPEGDGARPDRWQHDRPVTELGQDDRLLDRGRLDELANQRTRDGVSFLARFGLRALQDLETLLAEYPDASAGNATASSGSSTHAWVHRLKNGAAILGATQLEKVASRLQEAIETGGLLSSDDWNQLRGVLRSSVSALRTAIAHRLPSNGTTTANEHCRVEPS